MREVTREQVVWLVRRKIAEAGTLRAYCQRQGVHVSTLSNMLGGRNRWTPKVLRLLGLEHVRVVGRVDGRVEPLAALPTRATYRPMWRLGDWPIRYRVAEVL